MNNSPMVVRSLYVVGCVLLIVLTSIVFSLNFNRAPDESTVTSKFNSSVQNSTLTNRVGEIVQTTVVGTEPLTSDDSVTIQDLIRECPEPFAKGTSGFLTLSEQCVATLEPYFIDLPYIPESSFRWISIPNRITYRRIFQNPERDRDTVFETLSRAECQFEEGNLYRPDLQETCNAEAFYAYSSFYQICKNQSDVRNFYSYDLYSQPIVSPTAEFWEDHLTEISTGSDGSFSFKQFSRLKQDVWHTRLMQLWYRQRCESYDLSSILIDSKHRDVEQFRSLSAIRERLKIHLLGSKEDWAHELHKYHVLNIMAAYYGEFSASLSYVQKHRGPYQLDDRSFVRALYQKHPWLLTFSNVSELKSYGYADAKRFNWSYRGFISANFNRWLELDAAGVEYDFAALVDHFCRRLPAYRAENSKGKAVSCREAIEELKEEEHLSFKEGLKLDEFEKVAIKLGVWY
ncbi:MAG: hypothetical protein OXG88_11445 [Gammaproteobacteria bacterium]|nr:hypothetical protein [Gammaproteobacteria bacterium]